MLQRRGIGSRSLAVTLSAALLAFFGTATAAPDALAGLDRYIEQARADWQNVGLAVAVVHGTEVVYARGFGVKQFGMPDKVDADTLFQIGSTSKAFTAAALGLLVEEGKIRWDDPIVRYLPSFQLQDPWLTRNLTIRDAVAHRSGVPDNFYPYFGLMDADQSVRQLQFLPAEGAFRNSFLYNNLMYTLLGKLIEAVSGMSWHEFIQRRLLQPLAMSRSGTSTYQFWDAEDVVPTYFGSAPSTRPPHFGRARDANLAMPHSLDRHGGVKVLSWGSMNSAEPAGSIISSAADMAKWMVMQLNEGRFQGSQVLKGVTVEELHATQNPHFGTVGFPFNSKGAYALGWIRTEHRGHAYLVHGGAMMGFPATVALLPDQKMGVVVLSNGPESPYKYKLHRAIELWVFDRLLGAPMRDWRQELVDDTRRLQQEAKQAEESLRRSRLQNVPPSLPLEGYVGAYEDPAVPSGRVNVRLENKRLLLSFAGPGAFCGYLEHWHDNLFRLHSIVDGTDAGATFTTFTLDPSGNVTSMSIASAAFKFTLNRLASIEKPH